MSGVRVGEKLYAFLGLAEAALQRLGSADSCVNRSALHGLTVLSLQDLGLVSVIVGGDHDGCVHLTAEGEAVSRELAQLEAARRSTATPPSTGVESDDDPWGSEAKDQRERSEG